MKYISIIKLCLFLILVIGIGSGCTGNAIDNNKNMNISKVHTTKTINQTVANQAKEKVIRKEDISGVKAVNTDKELLLAIKVDNFDRFRLKKIEKNVKTDLEKKYPDYKILVSADSKFYLEVEKIEQKLLKDRLQLKSLNKELEKVKSLMKEQT